jgi:hypothetical protein
MIVFIEADDSEKHQKNIKPNFGILYLIFILSSNKLSHHQALNICSNV